MEFADSVFMFFSTALVWLMTPAIALFYGGLDKSKNVLSTAMYSVGSLAVVSILWALVGYSLAFSTSGNAFIGDLSWGGLRGVTFEPNSDYSETIPHSLFMMFQMTFAVLTVAIISGGFVGRMRFGAYLVFITIWSLFVYTPVAHWVWGVGGWLRELGTLDFAGGNVVHISSGVAGLVLAIVLGKRKDYQSEGKHNLMLVLIGGSLLWLGWFGFNVGSSLTLNDVAMTVFINTNIAAAAGVIGWVAVEWFFYKKPTLSGAVSGSIAGLVAITPACGFVNTYAAIIIGCIGGISCLWAITHLKGKFGYDDTLDAFGIHGVGGTWGGIATGIFASASVNPAGANGLLYGEPMLLVKQLIAIFVTFVFVAFVSYIIIKIVQYIMPIRVDEEVEIKGLDISIHGERAYID